MSDVAVDVDAYCEAQIVETRLLGCLNVLRFKPARFSSQSEIKNFDEKLRLSASLQNYLTLRDFGVVRRTTFSRPILIRN